MRGGGLVAGALLMANIFACGAGNRSAMSPEVLTDSWKAYVGRFIQQDGRVIDYRAHDISTSEGQAYAMLRAVWMKDRATFDKTYQWAINNLNAGARKDHLWAWKWGQGSNGKWQVLDRAFASDADQDAALALILASRTWNQAAYRSQARAILSDLWTSGTVKVAGHRYLLAGDTLCKADACKLNPSYYAPYAYRIFREYDRKHDWLELVDSSYFLLESVSRLTATRLPPDWVYLHTISGALKLGDAKESAFSYDAFRVYWRVALDDELFKDPRASKYLRETLTWVIREWAKQGKLPAVISSQGKPRVEYSSLEMLAALMPALRNMAPEIAAAHQRKLQSAYKQGLWADADSYYLQNWAWFGTALYQRYLSPFEGLTPAH